MNHFWIFFAALILSSCAFQGGKNSRWPSQAEFDADGFSPIVRRNEKTAEFCPSARENEVCLMSWENALTYCESRGAHLPTARDYVNKLVKHKIQVLEAAQVTGKPPEGFYPVDCKNPDGKLELFYMNHSKYERPAGDSGNHLLWTSSVPPKYPAYAHVFYDEWGGGGGDPKHHMKTHPNALQCVRGKLN